MKIEEIKNIRITPARKEILEILLEASCPLSYEDMKISLTMDKATFYRNITIFEDNEIVSSFESNDKKRYFEIQKSKHNHFICTNCSKIICVHEELNIELQGFQIDNIILKGICYNCLN